MKKSEVNNFRSYRETLLSREKSLVQVRTEAPLSIALVFPNTYAVGMSNLGFQALYRQLNEFPDVRCERSFYSENHPGEMRTLESWEALRNFDVVAFSISFELDYPNVVQILVQAGIEPYAEKRDPREPLVIAGGAMCFINPAPIEPFFDFMYIGEIEPQIEKLVDCLKAYRSTHPDRVDFVQSMSDIDGIYSALPSWEKREIQRPLFRIANELPQYSAVVGPDIHFKNMFLVEVGRGCGRHCYFCAASHVYHPLRIFSVEKILDVIQKYGQGTKRVGLIGSALSDYPKLFELCNELVNHGCELGLSSFRLDKITAQFMEVLERGNVKSLSFAPEAGTEVLRSRINKNLSDEQILAAARVIARSQISQIKLYFMIGLPDESMEDIEGIKNLVQRIYELKSKKQKISVSVNTFIPKPFTPFQWSKMETPKEIRKKRTYLKSQFRKLHGVQFAEKSVKDDVVQGVFSLGNSRVADSIYFKVKQGLDWNSAWQKAGIDVDSLLYQHRDTEHVQPWDFIQQGLKMDRLKANWRKEKV